MNIRVDVEITPEEVRRLMGLPDIHGFQEDLMNRIRQQMDAGAEGYDPQSLMQPFISNATASVDMFQKMMNGMMAFGAANAQKKKEDDKP
jgi:hypothetical protein